MLTKEVFQFLEALKENNTREWFTANKRLYETAHLQVEAFVQQVIDGVVAFDKDIEPIAASKCIFRIYRDVRFATDKSPYKTNFGASIAKGGRKMGTAGYYLHLEPGGSFVGGGIYMPEAATLKNIRSEIYFNSTEFTSILKEKEFKKIYGSLGDFDKLKKAPKDFPADFADIDLLKYRSYICMREVTKKEALSPDYADVVIKSFKAMKPFVDFLNRGIANG
ncbi:MAG TPA: DUF2461 domain-containing protein [Bacteroidales bacterium]